MRENTQKEILRKFDEIRPIYDGFTQKMEELAKELLNASSIVVHSVTSRTKGKKSLIGKIQRESEKYQNLEDITDLSAIRITCWFLEQVPMVAKLMKENFEVIDRFSVDKREIMDPDRFGYLSLHYIVRLAQSRKTLQEYKRYTGFYCEIQIRTILQHTWAEIQHDLGYKSQIGIPKSVKRRFYRLAGLLELADDEFQGLRKDFEHYSKIVEERLERKDKGLLIDKVSLDNYVKRSEIVNKIDGAIVSFFEGRARLISPVPREEDLKILEFFSIKTIDELDEILKERYHDILKFAKKWIRSDNSGSIRKGITIFYLGYVLAIETRDEEKIKRYLRIFPFPSVQKVAERLLAFSKEPL